MKKILKTISQKPIFYSLKKQLAQVQKQEQVLSQENETKTQQLAKVNKSVEFWKGEYQKALKAKPKNEPEPIKPTSPETKPINPWLLGTILVVVIGGTWLLNRRGK